MVLLINIKFHEHFSKRFRVVSSEHKETDKLLSTKSEG
jgi:hypothetical protein